MRRQPLPWFAWVLIAWLLLQALDVDLGLLPLLVVGALLGKAIGPRVGGRRPGALPPTDASRSAEVADPLEGPMSTIPVPAYPGEGVPGSWSSTPAATGPVDPSVSLGQLHLARIARELDAAARAGDRSATARLVGEVVEHTGRLEQILTSGSGPDGGRRAFLAGVRRLGAEAAQAVGEDPPGQRVAAVVRGAASLGQTGRHE